MTSTSTLGSTLITLQFDLSRNFDSAAQDVQGAITAAGQLLTLFTTPVVYLYLDRLQEWLSGAEPRRANGAKQPRYLQAAE